MNDYEQIIKENAQEYYTTGKQKLSDEAFDALVDEVQSSNPSSDVLKTGWGYEVNDNGKIKHKYGHIGSLNKVRDYNEISKSLGYQVLDISAKIDGISAVLYYTKGKLDLALTRGDGEYGIDITDKMKYIVGDSIVDTAFTGAIRGELVIKTKDFEKYKTMHPEAKNARNSIAGLINSDKITYVEYDYITFCAYSVVGLDQNVINQQIANVDIAKVDIADIRNFLRINFKNSVPCYYLRLEKDNYQEELEKLKNIWEKEYPIDGLVLTSINIKYNNETKEVKQNSVAYKFTEEIKITEIINIEWNMSKNSAYIPVAIIKPVELAGTTVKRATLYNAKYVKDNKLGTGAIVTVCKRGEIIPKVMEVIKEAEFADLPTHCGYCNESLVWDSVDLVCDNINCKQKENEDIKAVCMNLAPIDGLGWKTINKYLGVLNDVSDLLKLDEFKNVLSNTSEKGLFNQMLHNLKYVNYTLSQFLLALNIPGLGKIGAKAWENDKFAERYIKDIVFNNLEYYELEELKNRLGKIIQNNILASDLISIYRDKIRKYWDLFGNRILFAMPINDQLTKERQNNKLQGSVCITGKLSMKRDDFIDIIKQYGWSFDNTIKSTTTYLITDTPNSDTVKNRKADELGIKKVTENEFVNNIMRGE